MARDTNYLICIFINIYENLKIRKNHKKTTINKPISAPNHHQTRIDVYETLCPQQMLVHKGGKIKNWGGECRDVTPTKSLSQNIRVDVNREVKFL